MTDPASEYIIRTFHQYLHDKLFPCIAAHSAAERNHLRCMVADHMACPKDDHSIINFLYDYIEELRRVEDDFYSAVILFKEPVVHDEEMFDSFFWARLQALSDIDAVSYPYDTRVADDPGSPHFSFSLKEEAFYVIGLHPASSRPARRFRFPAMVFNAHVQFEKLREDNHYTKMQQVVRKRDLLYSGSINPMLSDFGEASEVFQYSGRQYDKDWKCPLTIRHARTPDHPTA